jgi:bacterioferritin (cytochrome b1)
MENTIREMASAIMKSQEQSILTLEEHLTQMADLGEANAAFIARAYEAGYKQARVHAEKAVSESSWNREVDIDISIEDTEVSVCKEVDVYIGEDELEYRMDDYEDIEGTYSEWLANNLGAHLSETTKVQETASEDVKTQGHA